MSTPHGLEHATRGPGSSKDNTFKAMSSRPGSITAQPERQDAAVAAALNSSLSSRGNAKTPPKKPIVGKKKPLEVPVNPLSGTKELPSQQEPKLKTKMTSTSLQNYASKRLVIKGKVKDIELPEKADILISEPMAFLRQSGGVSCERNVSLSELNDGS
nr:probable histone-arginine methyltransferase 1.3 [Tanacetum cinerariifolium]